jgi:DNA-binding beta-propeller fold protein YncE
MKTTTKIYGIALVLTCGLAITLRAQNLYIASYYNGTIGEYTTAGATVNASLISGLSFPWGIATSGNDIFVDNEGNGTIGEYTTAGATVNADLISGLDNPTGIAVAPVPEPSTVALGGLGSLALCMWRRRS